MHSPLTYTWGNGLLTEPNTRTVGLDTAIKTPTRTGNRTPILRSSLQRLSTQLTNPTEEEEGRQAERHTQIKIRSGDAGPSCASATKPPPSSSQYLLHKAHNKQSLFFDRYNCHKHMSKPIILLPLTCPEYSSDLEIPVNT